MRAAARGAAMALVLGAAACTTVRVAQPTLDRELAAALEARRLGEATDHLLAFRDGLLGEGTDRGRIDHAARAAAAARALGVVRAAIEAVHEGRLDREGRVDRDLALFLCDAAADDLRRADAAESAVARLSGDAAATAFLAVPGAPTPEMLGRMALECPRWFGAGPDAAGDPDDLRAAARRARQAADILRRRGMEDAILHAEEGPGRRALADAAAARAEGFAKALEEAAGRERAADGFAASAGRDAFVAALRTRHAVEATPEAMEAYGRSLLAETTAELEALAAAHWPGRTWKQALDEVRADHPQAPDVPGEALAAAEAARAFCLERGFVTIPPPARLGHVEIVGDDMARSYPFAAFSFRHSTAEGESGRYVVSPGATWMDAAQREERLRGACRAWTKVVAPHETWPGHHLQFWVADHLCSRLRREASTPVFIEGWGLYCESLLDEHGYLGTPAERLCLLAMRAWRASRVVLDVRLHCGGSTPAEGIDFLVENAGLTRDAATAEVRRYMSNPTQPFSYAWGRREILRLRGEERARLGAAFSEREFHDRLLRCGPIPFRFVRRLFGAEGE